MGKKMLKIQQKNKKVFKRFVLVTGYQPLIFFALNYSAKINFWMKKNEFGLFNFSNQLLIYLLKMICKINLFLETFFIVLLFCFYLNLVLNKCIFDE